MVLGKAEKEPLRKAGDASVNESAFSPVGPFLGEEAERLSARLRRGPQVGDVADVMSGLFPFEPQKERPLLNGLKAFTGDIAPYETLPGPLGFIRYDKRLTEFRPLRCFTGPRLLLRVQAVAGRPACASVDETCATGASVLTVIPRERPLQGPLLLGLLNSRITAAVAGESLLGGLSAEDVLDLPFPPLNPMNRRHRALQGEIVSAVYRLAYLCRERRSGKPDWANRVVERQIRDTDLVLDDLLSRAFGLDDDDRAYLGLG